MKKEYYFKLRVIVMGLILALTLSACGLFTEEVIIPTTADGYTALRDPFGETIGRWYLARPFAARAGESDGTWPADVYITSDGQTADVFPIALGKVVAVSSMNSTESWRGQYVVIEHTGQFRLPASSGTHIDVLPDVNIVDELSSNHMSHLVSAAAIYSPDATVRHDFTSESRYTLNEGTATKVYSVYKNLSNVSVKEGQTIKDITKSIGRINMAPTQPDYKPSLELEIRSFGSREINDSAFNVVLGPSGDGSFADVSQMLGFGYIEPGSFIQANLDSDYYRGLDPLISTTPAPTSEAVTTTPSASTADTDTTGETSSETESTGETVIELPVPVPATEAEIASVKRYLNEINNYFWLDEITTVPAFESIDTMSPTWIVRRFLQAAVRESESNTVSLSTVERLAQAKLNPDIVLAPNADYSTIPLTEWDAGSQTFAITPTGIENWIRTNDLSITNVVRRGDYFEAELFELAYVPIPIEGGSRNICVIASDNRYIGYYDHDNFDILAGNTGSVFRYELSGDSGALERYRYTIKADENGRFNLVSKSILPASSAYRDSLLPLESITINQAQVINTGGLQLRIRSGPSTNAAELGFIQEHSSVILIGPPSNGFNVIFDPRLEGHAPTGFAAAQYFRIEE